MATGIDKLTCRVCKYAFKNTAWSFNTASGKEAVIKFHQKIPLHEKMKTWTDEELEAFANSDGNTMGYTRNYQKYKEKTKQDKLQSAFNFSKEIL